MENYNVESIKSIPTLRYYIKKQLNEEKLKEYLNQKSLLSYLLYASEHNSVASRKINKLISKIDADNLNHGKLNLNNLDLKITEMNESEIISKIANLNHIRQVFIKFGNYKNSPVDVMKEFSKYPNIERIELKMNRTNSHDLRLNEFTYPKLKTIVIENEDDCRTSVMGPMFNIIAGSTHVQNILILGGRASISVVLTNTINTNAQGFLFRDVDFKGLQPLTDHTKFFRQINISKLILINTKPFPEKGERLLLHYLIESIEQKIHLEITLLSITILSDEIKYEKIAQIKTLNTLTIYYFDRLKKSENNVKNLIKTLNINQYSRNIEIYKIFTEFKGKDWTKESDNSIEKFCSQYKDNFQCIDIKKITIQEIPNLQNPLI